MNSQLEKFEGSKFQDPVSSLAQNVKRRAKIHLPIISGGSEMRYLRYSEEGWSRKNSSYSNDDFRRNQSFLTFG